MWAWCPHWPWAVDNHATDLTPAREHLRLPLCSSSVVARHVAQAFDRRQETVCQGHTSGSRACKNTQYHRHRHKQARQIKGWRWARAVGAGSLAHARSWTRRGITAPEGSSSTTEARHSAPLNLSASYCGVRFQIAAQYIVETHSDPSPRIPLEGWNHNLQTTLDAGSDAARLRYRHHKNHSQCLQCIYVRKPCVRHN